MHLFEKIIEALDIRLGRAYLIEVLSPFTFKGAINERNVLIQLNNGEMSYNNNTKIKPGSFLFIPQSQLVTTKVGKGTELPELDDEIIYNEDLRIQYLQGISTLKYKVTKKDILTVVSFEATLYNSFPFFPLMEMPAFHIPYDDNFAKLVKNLCIENEQENLGREIMLRNYVKEIVVMLCRYIESQPALKQNVEKLAYLNDKRLIDIVNYVNENLNKDLSNRAIASVAFVSEDYVGQFFKTLTNRNLQDYIEDQRLAKALQLLKSKPESVQEISHRVGFKDPAYFSRRFKMKFGINANAVKQGKSQIV